MAKNLKKWVNISISSGVAMLGALEGVNWLTITCDETTAGWAVTVIALLNIIIQALRRHNNPT